MVWDITSWKIKVLNPNKWRFGSDDVPYQLCDSLCSILSIFGSVVFVDTTPKKPTNVPQKGAISKGKSSSIRYFSGDMSVFRGVKHHLFHCLLNWCVCVCDFFSSIFHYRVWFHYIAQKGSQQNVFCFFHSSLAGFALSSLLFWVLSQHCGASNYMVFFSKFFWWCSYRSYKQHSFSKASLSSASSARGAKYSRPGPEAVWLGSIRGPRERLKGSKTLSE